MADGRERDLVLSPNSYVYVLDETKGLVSCVVGSYKMSLSNTDSPVVFSEKGNRFVKTDYMENAIQTFTTAPENWYVVLKNPTMDGSHPVQGTSNSLPALNIGKKINIRGPISFALYPGQMAKVVRGHRMHSNQYLLARVYNAEEANADLKSATKDYDHVPYVDGQIIVIKGTEQQFYIPPTGIEVLPVGGSGDKYIRDAVTLENLEYCVKKKETGEKLYIHGPNVVFPEPDETFVVNEDDEDSGYKFRAYELSDTSGIYVKVLMDYIDDDGEPHEAGDELFITGMQQRIYYPRKEHAIISYGDKVMNYAVAIPKGEGRYVLNRETGDIAMVTGPYMLLPNPITSVVVRRRLSRRQCDLWFPESVVALEANGYGRSSRNDYDSDDDALLYKMSRSVKSQSGGDTFTRGTTYTEPRTIEFNNKYKGVVTIDVWTGYAVNIVSKDGSRRIVEGPTSTMLEYDETLESLKVSTGKPKTTDALIEFVYLKTLNNKISDIISVQTKDFVDMKIKVSYCVDFLPEYKDRWFNIENYVKYLTDRIRSILRGVAKKFVAEDFYQGATEIIRGVILGEGRLSFVEDDDTNGTSEQAYSDMLDHENTNTDAPVTTEVLPGEDSTDVSMDAAEEDRKDPVDEREDTAEVTDDEIDDILEEILVEGMEGKTGMLFEENGMMVHDVEVLSVSVVDNSIGERFMDHQDFVLQQVLDLSRMQKERDYELEKAKINSELEKARHEREIESRSRQQERELLNRNNQLVIQALEAKRERQELEAKAAVLDLQKAIDAQEFEMNVKNHTEELRLRGGISEIETDKVESYAAMIGEILSGLSPEFAAAMNNQSNSELMQSIMTSMAPYSIANGESVVDTVIKLTHGSVLEHSLGEILKMFKDRPLEKIQDLVDEVKDQF